MSNSVWPHRWQPTRLSHPWDSPGKNTGVGCHFLLQCMAKSRFVVTLFPLGMLCCALVTQSCPTLCDPTDCSPLGSSVDGDSLGKNTVVGCHALLQGTFPTKGSKAGLPQGRQILYHLSYRASLRILQWVADPFFLTQKSNQGLQHCTWILYQLSYQGSPPSQYQFSCLVVSDSMTPWIAARQPSLSITNSWSLCKFMSIESMMPSNHLILCHPLLLLSSNFPSIRSSPMSQFFASGGQRIGASASASVPPTNIQDRFPLGLTGLIFLSKGHSRVLQHHSSKASILQSAAFFIYSLGICASKFPFPLIQFSITFSGKKPESWIKHLVVRMHPCLLASPPFTAMCS